MIIASLLAIGFIISVVAGVEIGIVIFDGNMYGDLYPASLGIFFGAVYNYILIAIYLLKGR